MKTYLTVSIAMLAGAAIGGGAIQGLHAQAKLPAYVYVESNVNNPEAYGKEYVPLAGKVIAENGGKFLVRGGKMVTIEGEPGKPRTIVIAFESLDKAVAAFASPEYKEARKVGDKYSTFRILAFEGTAQ
jgi:uncharacterized protein (DUF1330 family)